MSELRKWIADRLRRGETVVLAAVTRVSGSTSRGTDALLAMDSTGAMNGTVGGGFAEGRTMEAARCMLGLGAASQPGLQTAIKQVNQRITDEQHAALRNAGSAQDLDFDLTPETNQTQMVCGGRLRIHLERVEPQSIAANALLACIESSEKGKASAFVALRSSDGQHFLAVGDKCTPIDFASNLSGAARDDASAIPAPFFESLQANMPGFEGASEFEIEYPARSGAETAHVFWLGFLPDPAMYIFGAGHVGKAVCEFGSLAGFKVIVTDDRPEMLTAERFPHAYDLRLIHGFEDALTDASGAPGVTIGKQDYALVLTRKPDIDKAMLAQVLRTNAGYVGLIGSKSKRDGIFAALKAEGFTYEDIARVHAPIGLAIGARTPEEIAVSILAEIIAVRAGVAAIASISPRSDATAPVRSEVSLK